MTVTDQQATGLDDVRRDIMWSRLISVVEEQATTLVRAATPQVNSLYTLYYIFRCSNCTAYRWY